MRLVVIGGVAAGLSAATRAKRLDPSIEVMVLERGEVISYSACGLPYYVEGLLPRVEDLVRYTPEEFSRQRDVTVRTGADVAEIAHPRREVRLVGGERVRYDRLVIATGARPDTASLPGSEQPHVLTLHTPNDAQRLSHFVEDHKPRSAAVVGGGYIGVEAAEALRTRGLKVTLFEATGSLLGRTDEWFVRKVSGWLATFGIEVRLATRVDAIEPDRVCAVPAEVVVAAPGLKPNVGLAEQAGIDLGRTGAIRVNDMLETNFGGVYAAGDCAEALHRLLDRPVWIPLGTTANKMGRTAGANAAGRRERFQGIVGTSIVRVCGLGVGMTGLAPAQARAEGFRPLWARIDAMEKPAYFRGSRTTVELIADSGTGKLLGGCVMGQDGVAGRTNVIATALTKGVSVEEFAQLDLAYSPPYASVWDPLLIAAQQLEKQLCHPWGCATSRPAAMQE